MRGQAVPAPGCNHVCATLAGQHRQWDSTDFYRFPPVSTDLHQFPPTFKKIMNTPIPNQNEVAGRRIGQGYDDVHRNSPKFAHFIKISFNHGVRAGRAETDEARIILNPRAMVPSGRAGYKRIKLLSPALSPAHLRYGIGDLRVLVCRQAIAWLANGGCRRKQASTLLASAAAVHDAWRVGGAFGVIKRGQAGEFD